MTLFQQVYNKRLEEEEAVVPVAAASASAADSKGQSAKVKKEALAIFKANQKAGDKKMSAKAMTDKWASMSEEDKEVNLDFFFLANK